MGLGSGIHLLISLLCFQGLDALCLKGPEKGGKISSLPFLQTTQS